MEGGRGLEILLVANFFLPPQENKKNCDERPTIFFLIFVEELKYIFFYYVRYHFGVFSGQHIFHQFRQQTFFSDHIFNKLFFLVTPPPPPRYQMVRPSDGLVCQLFPPSRLKCQPTPIECNAGVTMWR